jgi:hypothetical protein
MSVSVIATAGGQALTSGGSTHSKGSYVALFASTSQAADGFLLTVTGMNDAADRRFLIDVAVGGAGSEVVILADQLVACFTYGTPMAKTFYVPIAIPAGSRVAARCQCNAATTQVFVALHLVQGDWATAIDLTSPVATTYGVTSASTQGTTIDPGAVLNTKGAYSQITAATSSTVNAKIAIIHATQINNNGPTTANFRFDLATGGAGSETVIWPDLCAGARQLVPGLWPGVWVVPVDIPTGTRVAVRAQADNTDATDRLFDVTITLIEGGLPVGSAGMSWAPLSMIAGAGLGLVRAMASA